MQSPIRSIAKAGDVLRIAAYFLSAKLRVRLLHGPLLSAFQNSRAKKILKFASQYSQFHADRFKHGISMWRQLPAIGKREMMSNFQRYNTAGISLELAMKVAVQAEESRDFAENISGLTVGLSSGTSGHRGIFLVSHNEQLRWAGTILSRTIPSIRLRGCKVALFSRSNSNLYETVGSSKWLRFRYFDLLTPIPVAVEELNQFKPDIIVGPPSFLLLLRSEVELHRLQVNPSRVISVAEVLEAQDKTALELAFRVPVHQIYQCTEGLIAACCDRGSLHLLEDVMAVDLEVLSSDSDSIRAVPIITDLWRKTQPIIRYRLNDVLIVEKKPCPCGSSFRVLRSIEGRCDDVLYLRGIDGRLKPVFSDLIRRVLLLATENISDYSVVQPTLGSFIVHLDLISSADFQSVSDSIQRSFKSTLSAYGCIAPNIAVLRGVPERGREIKKRRVQRTFSVQDIETANTVRV